MKTQTVHIPALLRLLPSHRLHVQSHEQLEDRYCITLCSGVVISLLTDGDVEVTPPLNGCLGIIWSWLEELLPRRTRYLRHGPIPTYGSSRDAPARVELHVTTAELQPPSS